MGYNFTEEIAPSDPSTSSGRTVTISAYGVTDVVTLIQKSLVDEKESKIVLEPEQIEKMYRLLKQHRAL